MHTIAHTVFWLIVVLLLTLAFGNSYGSFIDAFYFVAMLLPVIVSTSYFFNYFLVPRYLLKQRYLKFALYFVYTLIVSAYLEMIVLVGAFILLANYRYKNLNPVTTDVFVLLATLYLIVFLKAFILQIRKFFKTKEDFEKLKREQEKQQKGFINIRANRKNIRVFFKDIAYFESLADYLKIHLNTGEHIITKEKISHIYGILPEQFIRIHRSFIVNVSEINAFTKELVEVNGKQLNISRSYKKAAIAKLENLNSLETKN
ncbi:MAG: LytTR family DNA-binding domain-containing protein [Bacteroidota bacterium]